LGAPLFGWYLPAGQLVHAERGDSERIRSHKGKVKAAARSASPAPLLPVYPGAHLQNVLAVAPAASVVDCAGQLRHAWLPRIVLNWKAEFRRRSVRARSQQAGLKYLADLAERTEEPTQTWSQSMHGNLHRERLLSPGSAVRTRATGVLHRQTHMEQAAQPSAREGQKRADSSVNVHRRRIPPWFWRFRWWLLPDRTGRRDQDPQPP
jgi:hypothetical protein